MTDLITDYKWQEFTLFQIIEIYEHTKQENRQNLNIMHEMKKWRISSTTNPFYPNNIDFTITRTFCIITINYIHQNAPTNRVDKAWNFTLVVDWP